MPSLSSLGVILYMAMLIGVNLVIVIPTAEDYAERLGAGKVFSGLMIGLVPFAGTLGVFLNNLMLKYWPMKLVIILLSVGMICGNVLYALAGLTRAPMTLLGARSILGLCMGIVLPPAYISRAVGVGRRSEVMFYFSAVNTLGYAIGPALAALIELFVKNLRIENLVLDSDTAPGWFMAFLYLLFIVQVIVFFEDLPAEPGSLTTHGAGQRGCFDQFPACGAMACLWSIAVAGMVMTSVEVYMVDVGQHHLGWSIEGSALGLACLMFVAGALNTVVGRLTTGSLQSDRAGMLAVGVLGVVSCAPLFCSSAETLGEGARLALLAIGLTLVLLMAGNSRAFGLALITKLDPVVSKSLMSMLSTMGLTVGRGIGAILGSVLSTDSFAWCMAGLYGFTFVVTAISYDRMRPHDKAR